jgi:hypothetical protein
MIKQTFIITEEEKERILNLHISATENNYLTEQRIADLPNSSQNGPTPKFLGNPKYAPKITQKKPETTVDPSVNPFANANDLRKFQQWVKDNKSWEFNIGRVDGLWGTNSIDAWKKYKTFYEYGLDQQKKSSTLPAKSKQNDIFKDNKGLYGASVDSTSVSVGYNPITGQKNTTQKTYVDPKSLGGLASKTSLDDVIDIISAIIDFIPGVGTAVSGGIDIVHAISYVVRAIEEKVTEDKIVYFIQGMFGLGTALVPEAGNAANLSLRSFIETYLSWWDELMEIIKTFVNEKKVTKVFLDWLSSGSIRTKIIFAFTYLLKKIGINVSVSKLMTEASTQLDKLKNYISGIPGLEWLAITIGAFQKYLTPPDPTTESVINAVLSDPKVSGKMNSMYS